MIHGRFQPFHNGHLEYLRATRDLCDSLVVGITNPDPETIREDPTSEHRHLPESNPFTYFERLLMVRDVLRDEGVPPERARRLMRVLLIIFDGLADRPAAELDGKTPLEAARTPNLDRLAAEGINGLFHPKSPGYPLGSPLALHLMFGYPEDEFPDRGPLLASARGLPIAHGDVVLAARFASIEAQPDSRLRLLQRFVHGREEECRRLASTIAENEIDGLVFRYVYAGRGDGTLFIRGGASFEITDTDPLGLDLPVLKAQPRVDASDAASAARSAEALNAYLAWAHAQLTHHPTSGDGPPINFLITKWAGPKPQYEPFASRWGMRAASLPDEEVVSGLMLELGFHVEQIEEAGPEADLRRRLTRARAQIG